ncbi:MAG: hypothetical protein IJF32_11605 [Oscillospiraceae bacterium]|nr:hypothetical protein [Oscillospiraceae bacterium]
MKSYKITVRDVAKLTGKSELTIREGIKQEYFEFGCAMKLPGSVKWNFTIIPAKVAEFIGITVEELFERIREVRDDTKSA